MQMEHVIIYMRMSNTDDTRATGHDSICIGSAANKVNNQVSCMSSMSIMLLYMYTFATSPSYRDDLCS